MDNDITKRIKSNFQYWDVSRQIAYLEACLAVDGEFITISERAPNSFNVDIVDHYNHVHHFNRVDLTD